MLVISNHVDSTQDSFRWLCLVWQLLLFSVVYALNNQYALDQMTVRNVMTNWDAYVPFIDWMILPYSLSLPLFIYTFLQTNSRIALLTLSQHVTLATLLAGWIFYCFPLKFSTALPEINGWWYWAYQWLHLVDRPYNQLPSLHVIYSLIFGHFLLGKRNHLHPRSKRYNCLIIAIVLAIIVSTVFTYQHHIMDVFAGILVAYVLIFILRKGAFQPIAFFYFSLACIWNLLALLLSLPWLFFYFSITLAYIGYAYACNYAYIHQQNTSLFPFGSGLFLFPYRLIYWLMWQFNDRPYHTVLPYLSVGRRLRNDEVKTFSDSTYCIDLSCELKKSTSWNPANYQSFPLLDLHPITSTQALRFCELITSLKKQDSNAAFYVHCVMGVSRSYAMVACYLVYSQEQTADKVRDYLITLNPKCVLPEHYLPQEVLEEMGLLSRQGKAV